MTRSQLQSAVIQYVILISLELILSHEISKGWTDNVWEDPVLKNFTSVWNTTATPHNATSSMLKAYNGTTYNVTMTKNNTASPGLFTDPPEDFYTSSLPRNLFVWTLLCPLSYYWHLALERFFPTRPRGVEVDYEKKEKVEMGVNEDQEEEVVKRWIAQGKVRRSSISWWNTFVKWVIHYTVGNLWLRTLGHIVDGCVRWRSFSTILGNIRSAVFIGFLSSFLSIGPLASLIGFVVVPAQKRLTFAAGIDLLEAVFSSAFFRLVIPWAIKTEFVQRLLGEFTEGALKAQKEASSSMNGRLIDEL